MSITDRLRRLKRLEQQRTPLARAYANVRSGIPPRDWDTLSLEAFSRAENSDLHGLTDAELELLADDRGYDDGC